MNWLIDFLKYIFNANTGLPVAIGFVVGFFAGNIFSRHAWEFARYVFDCRREERFRKEQKDYEKQKIESARAFYKERANLGLTFEDDVYLSISGSAYCPCCYDSKKLTKLVPNEKRGMFYCTECDFTIDVYKI